MKVKKEIEDFENRINLTRFHVFNTSWAKDEQGNRDTTNLAVFVEFVDNNGEKKYWLPRNIDLKQLNDKVNEVDKFNKKHENRAKKFWGVDKNGS